MGALPYVNPTNAAEWSQDLLAELGDTATSTDVANIERVIGAESGGNQAGFLRDNNPWNLNTYTAPHSSLPGGKIVSEFGIHVQTFPTATAGIQATAAQIEQSPALTAALADSASPAAFGTALGTSAWKSASYANATKFPTLQPFEASSAPAFPFAAQSTNPLNYPGEILGGVTQSAGSLSSDLTKSVFGPVAKWIEEGAADVTFVGFGLLLIVVGLVVTFKGGPSSDVAGSAGVAKDAAAAAVA